MKGFPKFPVRAVEIIGKSVPLGLNGGIEDAAKRIIRRNMPYKDAEDIVLAMNHVNAVWEFRSKKAVN